MENKIHESNFWDDNNKATSIIDEVNELKKIVERITNLKNKIESNLELVASKDEEIIELLTSEVDEIKEDDLIITGCPNFLIDYIKDELKVKNIISTDFGLG